MRVRTALTLGAFVLLIPLGWAFATDHTFTPSAGIHFDDGAGVDRITSIQNADGYRFGRCVFTCVNSRPGCKILHIIGYWDVDKSGTLTRADTIAWMRDQNPRPLRDPTGGR